MAFQRKVRAANTKNFNGHTYNIHSLTSQDCWYIKCNQRSNKKNPGYGCRGSARLIKHPDNTETIIRLKKHKRSCPKQVEHLLEVHALKIDLKVHAKTMPLAGQLSNEYDNLIEKHPVAAQEIPFKTVRSQMGRDFRVNQPRNPVSFLAFTEFVTSPRGREYLKYTLVNEQGAKASYQIMALNFGNAFNQCLAFYNVEFLNYFDGSQINIDGTFRFTSKFKRQHLQPYQHLIISSDIDEKIFPAIYVLMPNKKETTYKSVLTEVKNSIIPDWRPKFVISDWETGLRNAAQEVYPNTSLVGCFFHYTQAIEKNWKKYGLTPLSKSSFKALCLKKLVMALPLASADDILTLFIIIVLLIPPPMFLKLNDFMAYVFNHWLATIGPANLSCG